MAKNNVRINENFCFDFRSGNIGVKTSAKKFYEEHRAETDNWWQPESKIPLFIDTNFLLEAYCYPKEVRNLFVNFLKINKTRIYVVDQVDEEFQRKRPNFVQNYTKSITGQYKCVSSFLQDCNITGYCDSLAVKLENLKKNPYIRTDFGQYVPVIEETIARIKEWSLATKAPSEYLYKELNEKFSEFARELKAANSTQLDDKDLIEAISACKFCEKISDKEKTFIIELYDKCHEEREKMRNRPDNIDLSMFVFPGLGDLGKEVEGKQKEGDFLLYHEMLKEIKQLDKNVIFISSDVKKGDNATEKKEPYDHYITNCFSLTKHVYYLVDGKSLPLTSIQPPLSDTDYDESDDDSDEVSLNLPGREVKDYPEKDLKHKPFFRELTKEEFLKQYNICLAWANDYGDKYVSKDYFIYGILGHKRYEFAASRDMLQSLIDEGLLEVVSSKDDIDCIVVKDKDRFKAALTPVAEQK